MAASTETTADYSESRTLIMSDVLEGHTIEPSANARAINANRVNGLIRDNPRMVSAAECTLTHRP